MPVGQNGSQKAPEFPDPDRIPVTATLEDHFWFAKIIYISEEHETAHVQWFWHSSTTAMEELNNPQELFLAELCDTIELRVMVGKVVVHYHDPRLPALNIKPDEFYYKYFDLIVTSMCPIGTEWSCFLDLFTILSLLHSPTSIVKE
jgi:DNA (cytosine-5)-methyltransferase 1